MATFKDAAGREWSIELDVPTADEIKREKGIDLIDPDLTGETFVKLASGSTRLLVEVLWMLIHEQAAKRGVEPEDFGRAMKPAAIRDAFQALRDGIADFFLNPDAGAAMRRVWRAAERVVAAKLGEYSEAKIESLLMERTSENSAGNTAASAELTPAGVE